MSKPLIVVESPTKVRTIQKYLGKDYKVVATVGHIRDLPERELGIDIQDGFVPKYITIPGSIAIGVVACLVLALLLAKSQEHLST